ncbi:hypothetical protein IAU59_006328 [Kwoniella sp. CBS 9459]
MTSHGYSSMTGESSFEVGTSSSAQSIDRKKLAGKIATEAWKATHFLNTAIAHIHEPPPSYKCNQAYLESRKPRLEAYSMALSLPTLKDPITQEEHAYIKSYYDQMVNTHKLYKQVRENHRVNFSKGDVAGRNTTDINTFDPSMRIAPSMYPADTSAVGNATQTRPDLTGRFDYSEETAGDLTQNVESSGQWTGDVPAQNDYTAGTDEDTDQSQDVWQHQTSHDQAGTGFATKWDEYHQIPCSNEFCSAIRSTTQCCSIIREYQGPEGTGYTTWPLLSDAKGFELAFRHCLDVTRGVYQISNGLQGPLESYASVCSAGTDVAVLRDRWAAMAGHRAVVQTYVDTFVPDEATASEDDEGLASLTTVSEYPSNAPPDLNAAGESYAYSGMFSQEEAPYYQNQL